jgi:hypothetical protein
MERTAEMTAWTKKLGAALGALALVMGAVPGTVGMASAYGVDKQILEKPPRDPPSKFVIIGLVIASLVGIFFVVKGGSDKPASP